MRILAPVLAAVLSLLGFAQAPPPRVDTFTFLHVSDPHVSPANVAHLERVRQIAIERKPVFVLITGDLIADALRVSAAEARGYFEPYKKTIETFPIPVRSALGNHDIFGIERDASGVSADHPLYGKKMFRHYVGASVVPPFANDPIRTVSGVTLYRVAGTEIDNGEFIRLDGK